MIGAPFAFDDGLSSSSLGSYALKDGTNFTNPTTWLTGLGLGDITFTNAGRTQTFAAGNVNFTFASNAHFILTTSGTGMVGINVATPVCALHVGTSLTTSPRGIMSAQYSTGTDGSRFHLRKARGTEGSPLIVVTGDTLGRIQWSGYDGSGASGYLEMASIRSDVTGTVAAGRVPTQLVFSTATDAATSVLTDYMTLGSAGGLTITTTATASTPGLNLNGSWFTGGSATTTKPQLLVQPSGATSTAWSTSGTGLGINSATGFVGRLIDIQSNGVSIGRCSSRVDGLGGSSWFFNYGTNGADSFIIARNGATAWTLSGNNTHWTPGTDNSSDIGTAAAQVRTGYFGTSVFSPVVSIGTTTPGVYALAVNQATGQVQDWIYNDSDGSPANHMSLVISSGGNATFAPSGGTLSITGTLSPSGPLIASVQSLSGPGAANVTQFTTAVTTTGVAEAITLANGTVGQIKVIVHAVDGGSAIITPATPLGYSTITITNAGDAVTLQYLTQGWAVVGSKGAVIA